VRLFGGSDARNAAAAKSAARIPRVSSGWSAVLKALTENEGQRILDFGPTSPTNINFLTGLGHSIYMADLAGEAADPKWVSSDVEAPFACEAFLEENLQFSGREFDTVLFWDTGDYLVPELREAVVARLHQVLVPGGQLLALFHIKPDVGLHRYHLRDDAQVDVQFINDRPTGIPMNNRQIENLFGAYRGYRFFLAKDNLREVLVTR
jgi:SAM-dependent methyltransferase